MNIIILNKFEVENTKFDSSHIVISMIDHADNFPNIPEKNCKGILKTLLGDAEDGNNFKNINDLQAVEIPDDKIFNITHAQEILKFVFTYLDEIEFIICQSNSGWSQSAGAAAALSKILNGNDIYFFQLQHVLNKFIYETILNEYEHMQIT